MAHPQAALIVVALLVLGGGYYLFTDAEAKGDPLKDAQSGVAASLTVHAAILDGANGGPASSVSARFSPTARTASLTPAAVGETFKPLAMTDYQSSPGCKGGLKATIGAWDGNGNPTWLGPDRLYTPRSGVQGYVQANGVNLIGTTVSLYRNGGFYGGSIIPSNTYSFSPTQIDTGTNYRVSTGASQFTENYCTYYTDYITQYGTCASLPCNGGGNSAGEISCTQAQDPGFVSYLHSIGVNPNCVPTSRVQEYWNGYVLSQNSSSGNGNLGVNNNGGQSFTSALIPVTITGDVTTKNLAKNVTITGEMVLKTAAGKTITRSFPTITVPTAGGPINGMSLNLDIPKADIGTGTSTMEIKLVATSQDFGGESRAANGVLTLTATTDYRGSVSMQVRAASMALSLGMDDGSTKAKGLTLAPTAMSLFGSE